MRQTYEVIGGPTIGRTNLPVLRATLKSMELDGLYIPHDDEYQNEYLPACYERLAWATGFTGSAGSAFVFQKSAIVFVDGRYTLQVKQQLAPKLFEVGDLVDLGPFGWLAKRMKYQDESANVSSVSVSRTASPPQDGHATCFHVGWRSSGLPGISKLTSSGSTTGN